MNSKIQITYYLEVISSWCHWAEPAWKDLRSRFSDQADFHWKIALMDPAAFPQSREQCDWFYRRGGTVSRSPYRLNSGWFEEGAAPYPAPNLVALAAQEMGFTDDSVRLALSTAALRDGKKVGRWEVAVDIAAKASGISPDRLLQSAQSPATRALADASTAEFHQLQVSQRPAFVLESPIGDQAVFSGLSAAAPIAATLQAMLHDMDGYASFRAHFGDVPA